jgi:hypothetical protein
MTEQDWLVEDDPKKLLLAALDCPRDESTWVNIHWGNYPYISKRKLHLFACACVRSAWEWLDRVDSRRAVEAAENWADLPPAKKTKTSKSLDGYHRRAAEAASVQLERNENFTFAYVARNLLRFSILPFTAFSFVANDMGDDPLACALLRDVVGDPWRRMTRPAGYNFLAQFAYGAGMRDSPRSHDFQIKGSERWLTPEVLAIADQVYRDHDTSSGRLNCGVLSILADALVDADCPEEYEVERYCKACGGRGLVKAPPGDYARTWPCDECDSSGRVKMTEANRLLAHLRGPGPHVRGCWVVDLLLGKE